MASLTIENYVKCIYLICRCVDGSSPVTASTGEIAQQLNVSPGTVTSMLKTLNESGLAEYTPYEGVRLTGSGQSLALRILRRHRLVEAFLVETLKFNWDEVHDEAENLEHAVSDLLIDRIDQFLDYPQTDPYGDPIPRTDGSLPATGEHLKSLGELEAGESFRLRRVADQSIKFLRYLTETSLQIGSRGRVVSNCEKSGVVQFELQNSNDAKVPDQQTIISRENAAKLKVELVVEIA